MPTLFQIMACHLFGSKPLSEPMLPYCQLDPKEHILVKIYSKFTRVHSRKNVVCEMAAMLFQPQCVNDDMEWKKKSNCIMSHYHQISNIIKSWNFNVSRLFLHLSFPNPLNPCIKKRIKKLLKQRWQAMLQLHLSDQQFYCLTRCGLY